MSEHVYKSVEITGSSPEGVTQAIDRAVAKASETLRHLDWFELTSVSGEKLLPGTDLERFAVRDETVEIEHDRTEFPILHMSPCYPRWCSRT
jgi:flavin-binding protein dodecin